MTEIILSPVFHIWYWTIDKAAIPNFTIFESAVLSVRYNGGTAALGGPLIVISRIIRLMSILWSKKRNEMDKNSDSQLKWCNDLNYNAYTRNALVMCGIYGDGFHNSAERANQLISENMLQCIDTNMLTGIVFGFAKVLIVLTTGIVSWFYFEKRFDRIPLLPVSILMIGGYSIADVFFSVYAIAVDTLVLCAREFDNFFR